MDGASECKRGDGGTHCVLVGNVEKIIHFDPDGSALLYYVIKVSLTRPSCPRASQPLRWMLHPSVVQLELGGSWNEWEVRNEERGNVPPNMLATLNGRAKSPSAGLPRM